MLYRRRLAVTAVIPVIAMAVVTCGDDGAAPPPGKDSGAQQGQISAGVCPLPDAAPEAGEGCLVPEGTTCSFGNCDNSFFAQCTRGRWKLGSNPAPPPTCPLEIPASEFPCPSCFPETLSCLYGTCDGADATANVSSASCDAGRWQILTVQACPRPDGGTDGGPKDAGADVQRDADADVD